MHGPKVEIILQKATETDVAGTTSVEWSNVETISKARLRPLSADERLIYAKDSTVVTRKCLIGYNDIAEVNRQYLTAKGKILIDDVEWDIESAEPVTGPGAHYKVILRRLE